MHYFQHRFRRAYKKHIEPLPSYLVVGPYYILRDIKVFKPYTYPITGWDFNEPIYLGTN